MEFYSDFFACILFSLIEHARYATLKIMRIYSLSLSFYTYFVVFLLGFLFWCNKLSEVHSFEPWPIGIASHVDHNYRNANRLNWMNEYYVNMWFIRFTHFGWKQIEYLWGELFFCSVICIHNTQFMNVEKYLEKAYYISMYFFFCCTHNYSNEFIADGCFYLATPFQSEILCFVEVAHFF